MFGWYTHDAIGLVCIANTEHGICFVGFGNRDLCLDELRRHYPNASCREQQTDMQHQAFEAICCPTGTTPPLHIDGTPFQIEVWRALMTIDYGTTCSYKNIAESIHRPNATRAVGSAIGKNPVSYFIPCHRVIHSDGTLGGYLWGLSIKQNILNIEQDVI